MKYLYNIFFSILTLSLLSGCSKIPDSSADEFAFITFGVSPELMIDVDQQQSKAALLPPTADFTIEIYQSGSAVAIHKFQYKDRPEKLKLESGDYTLKCYYGETESLHSSSAAYSTTENATFVGRTEPYPITFKPTRTHLCLDINYSAGFEKYYSNYRVSVSSPALETPVEFGADGLNTTHYFKKGAPYTATLLASKITDNSNIAIELAQIPLETPKSYHLLTLSFPAPKFEIDAKTIHAIKSVGYIDGQNISDPIISTITTTSPIESITYTFGGNSETESSLKIIATGDDYDKSLDLTQFVNDQLASPTIDSKILAITVTDKNGKSATQNITITNEEPQFDITATAGSMWSYTAYITVTASEKYANKYVPVIEQSTDGVNWTAANCTKPTDATPDVICTAITALQSNTNYSFRARMGSYTKPLNNLKTETPTQVPNSGFEDWTIAKINKNWHNYMPWNSNVAEWWNTSNPRCFTYNAWGVTQNQYNNPTSVLYTKEAKSGGKTAEIRSVKIDVGGRDNVCGKLLIGTLTSGSANSWVSGNNNPEYLTEGRNFDSRPTKVRFWYKYDLYGDDNYVITIRVRNGTTVIGEKIVTGNQTVANYQQMELEIPYSRTDLKATSLYICFASSRNDSFPNRTISVLYPDGWDTNWQAKAGSILWIDDVELIYEK